MSPVKFILSAILLLFSIQVTLGQGCSDAGFCSAGSLKTTAGSDSIPVSTVALKFSYGSGEEGVNIVQLNPELNWDLSTRFSVQAAIPYVITSGDLGSNSGIGDLLVNATYKFHQTEAFTLRGSVGGKLPTGNTDESFADGVSFPMPYQTGLGTYDLIAGISASYKNWLFAAGYQGVLKNENKNSFLYARLPLTEIENASGYFESNLLDRGDDVLFRVSRSFKLNKTGITPGILAIYRIQKDKITNFTGNEVALDGSDGLTLNLTVSSELRLNKLFSLLIEAGAPLVVRDVRADGLTRSFVASASLRYHFK